MLPHLTGTLIWVRGYLGCNMGLLWPLQELPGPGLHGKNVIAFVTTNEKIGCQLFFLVLHMSPPRWGLHILRLWYSWIWRRSARTPKNYKQNYQLSDGGPYVQGYQDSHKWRPHHIGDICTTRFSYMSYNVTKCTFLAILVFFLGGGGEACYV